MKFQTKFLFGSFLTIGMAGFGAFLFMPSAVSDVTQNLVGKIEREANIRTVAVATLKGSKQIITAQAEINITTDATAYASGISQMLGLKNQVVYTAPGIIKAGFDLSSLSADSVRVSGDSITITLPPPIVIASYLDTSRQVVYDHKDFLAPDTSLGVQEMAQKKAVEALESQVCSSGILVQANQKASESFKSILAPAGIQTVQVVTKEPNCPVAK